MMANHLTHHHDPLIALLLVSCFLHNSPRPKGVQESFFKSHGVVWQEEGAFEDGGEDGSPEVYGAMVSEMGVM